MDWSTPAFPVHHKLLGLAQTYVPYVGDAIQPAHPLPSPSPPAFNISQHQALCKWVSSSHQVAKALEFQLQHQLFRWMLRTVTLGSMIFAGYKLPSCLSSLDLSALSFLHHHLCGCAIYCCLPYTLGLLPDDALRNPSQFPAGVWTLIRSHMTSISQALDGTKQTPPCSAQIAVNMRRLDGCWPHHLEVEEQWETSFYGLGNTVLTDTQVKIGLFETFKQGGLSLLHRMRWIWPWSCAPWRHCLQRLPCLPRCYDGEKVTH